MIEHDLDKMLFSIPSYRHSYDEIVYALENHREIRFVSFVGIDIGGHDTDEKIPAELFIKDMDKFLTTGVQTDGSSVVLPKIAKLNNAKVDIIPDLSVNWYVDYNFGNIDCRTGKPIGTLRIPSYLIHNDTYRVGSRVMLQEAVLFFKEKLMQVLRENPYIFDHLPIENADEIDEIIVTSATELEFWVKTPEDNADREQLSTAQILKEQYWKRTIGPVRSALEDTLIILDKYGFEVEMGHKEVGGVKAKFGNSGHYDHVMEQLEIDWKFTDTLQAADNENQVKYIVKDRFRQYGLDVTFMAKPIDGVAGSGEHTHLGVAVKLKDGSRVNLFTAMDPEKDFMSPVGFGALLGLLKNYEVINPFVSSTNDAFNRLKPGYEAPVCIVTSLGRGVDVPSRNRTVLVGLVREKKSPLATRFELRAPNPKSNTYLVLAASYMAMLDGITRVLEECKTSKDLEASLSKECGEEDFYLEKDRMYRSEEDVFEMYTEEERDRLFGKAPLTVWENLQAFKNEPLKLEIFKQGDVMPDNALESYEEAVLGQWMTELHNRIVPENMDVIRKCVKCHDDKDCVDFDVVQWKKIEYIRNSLGRDTLEKKCLLTEILNALENRDYGIASDLQIEMQKKIGELRDLYVLYKKNLF